MAVIAVPRRPNPWDPSVFGPLRLTEDFAWEGRTVILRALYVTHRKPMTETDLTRSYWLAAYKAEWYDGNNPGKQVSLDKEAARLREEMRAKGFDPDEIDRRVLAGRSPNA